jgi:hypothetical protein
VSSSTSSTFFVTAIVVTVTLAEVDGLPVEVAVIVDVSLAPSAAAAGTVTETQTFAVSPGLTVGVAVIGVVHVASRKLTAYVPPVLESEYESGVKPAFLIPTV